MTYLNGEYFSIEIDEIELMQYNDVTDLSELQGAHITLDGDSVRHLKHIRNL